MKQIEELQNQISYEVENRQSDVIIRVCQKLEEIVNETPLEILNKRNLQYFGLIGDF